jgi:pimeloyl-ACP methyl ester carboxylesterase
MRRISQGRTALAAAFVAAALLAMPMSASGATTDNGYPIRCAVPGQDPITVVLVHGAWADNSSWAGEVSELQRDGCQVRAADVQVHDLATDATGVSDFVSTIPGPVLLVGHSYGGAVISNAATHAPNVVGLVYVDAYEPAVGEAISQLGGATSAIATHSFSEIFQTIPGAPAGSLDVVLTKDFYLNYFASDLPKRQALEQWATQTVASTAALQAPATSAAWQTLPSWAFISTGDMIITPDSLRSMANRAGSQITTFQGGSHVTLVSHPGAVTATIGKALASLLAAGK